MFRIINISLIPVLLLIISCSDDQDAGPEVGSIEIKFDNIVGQKTSGILSEAGETQYPFSNALDQTYNLTLVKYIISEIVLEGPNGEYHADPLNVSVDELAGYYLINEAEPTSANLVLTGIPPGTYNKISFKMGVEEEGVTQGTGIFLDGMFWTWNSGYIALKIEGQSPDSDGGSFGDTIEETNPFGFAYHIGGWGSINNNQAYSMEFDQLEIGSSFFPSVHILMNVENIFDGPNEVNFQFQNSVHSPRSGTPIAANLDDLFSIDHAHQ